jgi:hypothetical protein
MSTSPTTYSRLAHAALLRLRSFNGRKSDSDSIYRTDLVLMWLILLFHPPLYRKPQMHFSGLKLIIWEPIAIKASSSSPLSPLFLHHFFNFFKALEQKRKRTEEMRVINLHVAHFF